MGDGIHSPYTSEDIRKKIEERGKAEGLDLSYRNFEENIDLTNLDLCGIILNNASFYVKHINKESFGARFNGSNLEGAKFMGAIVPHADFGCSDSKPTILRSVDLRNAQLQQSSFRGADLSGAQLQALDKNNPLSTSVSGADFRNSTLYFANFTGCDCSLAKFEGAYLRRADIYNTNLEEVIWDNYAVGEENSNNYSASNIYRELKIWYTNAGMYDVAGEFYFKEMTAKRKLMKWWPKPWYRCLYKIISVLCGYGERLKRVIFAAIGIVFGLAVVYFLINTTWNLAAFGKSLYYSVVSFTALGYGSWIDSSWIDINNDWIRGIGAAESFLGVFMMSLFLITFVRKMTR